MKSEMVLLGPSTQVQGSDVDDDRTNRIVRLTNPPLQDNPPGAKIKTTYFEASK